MVTREIEVDDAIWERWTSTLPPDTSPDRRVADLLLADLEGRVDAGAGGASSAADPPYDCPLCAETFATLDDRDRHLVEDHEVAPI